MSDIESISKEQVERYYKRVTTVCNLLLQIYKKDIRTLTIDDSGLISIIFENKPDQRFQFMSPTFDTWNVVKSKFEKLINSDGVCVICCEVEKGKVKLTRCCDSASSCKKKVLRPVTYSGMCQTCCELTCKSCMIKAHSFQCAVCRQCLQAYTHKYFESKCNHLE